MGPNRLWLELTRLVFILQVFAVQAVVIAYVVGKLLQYIFYGRETPRDTEFVYKWDAFLGLESLLLRRRNGVPHNLPCSASSVECGSP